MGTVCWMGRRDEEAPIRNSMGSGARGKLEAGSSPLLGMLLAELVRLRAGARGQNELLGHLVLVRVDDLVDLVVVLLRLDAAADQVAGGARLPVAHAVR